MTLISKSPLQLLIILFGTFYLIAGNAAAAKRVALVIGNSNYQNTSSLKNPVNDASLMASSLEQAGFEVTKILDADYRTLKRALLTFGRSLYNSPEAGLFYYAGHGVQVRGENYLIPVNAKIDKEDEIDFEAIPVNNFLRVMNSSTSSINIVVLDACRNNPFARSFRSTSRGLAPVDAPKGTYIAYATAPGDVAADGKGKNSPYTAALSKAISIPGITIEKAFKTARQSVLKVTNNQQVPWETSSITGDFYFFEQEKITVIEEPTIQNNAGITQNEARAVYNDIKNSGDITTLKIFAKQFPNSIYTKFAIGKIEAIEGKNRKKLKVASLPIIKKIERKKFNDFGLRSFIKLLGNRNGRYNLTQVGVANYCKKFIRNMEAHEVQITINSNSNWEKIVSICNKAQFYDKNNYEIQYLIGWMNTKGKYPRIGFKQLYQLHFLGYEYASKIIDSNLRTGNITHEMETTIIEELISSE